MTELLESYAAGRWFRAEDEGTPLHDAGTGEEVARISASGLDPATLTAYAREVGGPALRALTFHERAGLLKAMAKDLTEHKDAFYALSTRTGATRRDSMVDIDGGIGTVFSFASKGTRELPNDTVVLDGASEQLGRAGTFLGQHLYTSRQGIAVQINAFNFPVWGFLEKLAPGLPGRAAEHRQAGQPDRLPHRGRRPPHHRVRASCRKALCSCCAAALPVCSRSWVRRTRSPSPAPLPPAPRCVSTRPCCTVASGSASRRTRSTARSSAPT